MKIKIVKKIICLSIVLSFVCSAAYSYSIHKSLSDELLRLHIVANSDSEVDQNLKLRVRDEIIKLCAEKFEHTVDKKSCRRKLMEESEQIREAAQRILDENNADYNAEVNFERIYIPRKSYGGIILPEGSYDAAVVKLGRAEGKNWWCVVYPPLCFTEAVGGELSDEAKEYLKSTISEESYELISGEGINMEYKLKIVEIFQKIKKKL